jgi:oligoribonuclease
LIWIDLEMTGLDPEKEVILEIATIVTDSMLEVLAEGPVIAINYSEEVLATMEAWSKWQHESSGLVERARTSTYDCRRAEEEVSPLRQHGLAGSSIPDQAHAPA